MDTKDNTVCDSTVVSDLETISNSFDPIHTHRNDAQVELNKYYINYIDDPLDENESNTEENNEKITSVTMAEDNSCQLEVSELPKEIFFDENIQCEFECIFHEFDPKVMIRYSKFFQKAYLTFSNPLLAFQVRTNMNGKEFHHKKLQIMHFSQESSSMKYLKPPKQDRIHLQSPPTTPPIGWFAKREELPEINFNLFLALSKLKQNEPLEILPKQNNFPAIVIHPCSDTSDEGDDCDDITDSIMEECVHKKCPTFETKQHDHILYDTILASGEHYAKETIGDGDKLNATLI